MVTDTRLMKYASPYLIGEVITEYPSPLLYTGSTDGAMEHWSL